MICQDVMDGGRERLMNLLCTHTFHEYCIRTYCDETSSTVECIRCPSCRRTAADVQQLPVPSDAVGGGVMAPPDVAANGAHDVEASNELPPPAPAVATVTDPAVAAVTAPAVAAVTHPAAAAVTDRAPAADVASGSFWPEPMVMCNYCGDQCDVAKVRIRSKAKNTWICNRCNCNKLQLHRLFGAFPPDGCPDIPDNELQEFFKRTHGMDPRTTKDKWNNLVKSYVSGEEYFAFDGEFVPLSVWSVRGFDATRTAIYSNRGMPRVV